MSQIPQLPAKLAEQQLDLLPVGLCVIDRDHTILKWNATLVHWTGHSTDTMLGSNLLDHYPQLASARFLPRIQSVFESGQSALFAPSTTNPFLPDSRNAGEGKREMLLKTVLTPVGKSSHYAQLCFTNVTAQYDQIQALRHEKKQHNISRNRTLAILETAADPIITITEAGNIESFNTAAERLFGYLATEVIGTNVSQLMPTPFREAHDEYLARYLSTGKQNIIGIGREVVGLKKDGTICSLWLSVSDVTLEACIISGSKRLFTGILSDLTEQKSWKKQLRNSKKLAEEANRAKSDFLANMSHEIRTPMMAILGYSEQLLEEGAIHKAPPERVHAIQTIRRNGQHLLAIINDILDMSKIEAGKMSAEQIQIDPVQIVSEVVASMQPRAQGKGLGLVVNYETPIPVWIESDPTRLRQIISNLVGNSIKFTDVGSITLHIAADPGRQRLSIRVVDTGIGMGPEQLDIIVRFEAFCQADGSTTRKFGGTGLGLRISNTLAQLLGGGIEVESVAGEGSSFNVTISTGDLTGVRMLNPEQIARHLQQATPGEKQKAVPQTEKPLQGSQLLLAEDGPDNQRLISFFLKKAGADVTVAENGQIAVDEVHDAALMRKPFDVILMDMQMPELDGYGATRLLRQEGYKGTIIALTAHAMNEDRKKCLDAGCDDFATKPIDRHQLVDLVNGHLVKNACTVGDAG
ncbi:MAG: PAS domain S-box protein [Pirellulales bacterium]